MLVNLNETSISRLPFAQKGSRYEVRDKRQPGLILRVGPRSKSFYWRTRVNNTCVKVHLGEYNHTNVDQARMEVLKLILQSREGALPPSLRKEKALRKPVPTLQQVYEHYIAMRQLRATSKETYGKIMRLYLQDFAARPVTQITGDDCYQLYSTLRDGKSPAKANSVLQLLDSLVRYAGTVYELDVCQVKAKVKAAGLLAATPARESRIKEAQLAEWFTSLKPRPLHYRVMLLTTILTGFRKAEIEKLVWNDFDPAEGCLLARCTKNHQDHLLPLGPRLIQVLEAYKAQGEDGPIFGSRVDRWASLASDKGGIPFSMHALRRTFATLAAKVTGNPMIVKILMNHSNHGDVTMKNYVRAEREDLASAMLQIEDCILSTGHIVLEEFLPELAATTELRALLGTFCNGSIVVND